MIPSALSLQRKIVLPIFTLFALSTVALLAILLFFSHGVSRRFAEDRAASHGVAVHAILDRAVEDLVQARLSGVPVVVAAKQQVALREVERYLAEQGLEGEVVSGDGRTLLSTLRRTPQELVLPALSSPGAYHRARGFLHATGYAFPYRPWEWKVLVAFPPVNWILEMRGTELGYLLPVVFVMGTAFVAVVVLILRTNLQLPMAALLDDLSSGRPVAPTGIREFDTIGEAVNESLDGLKGKAAQVQTLHDVAVSVHGRPRDEAVHEILERVGGYLGATHSALALYGADGEVEKTITVGSLPPGISLPRRDDLVPLLAQGAVDAMGGTIVCPLPAADGPSGGVLLFSGKEGGFTAEDETLLRAVAADTGLALAKADRISELNRFKRLIDSAFDLVVLFDENGRISYVNPACEGITGYSPAEMMGKDAAAFVGKASGGASLAGIRGTLRAGAPWRGDLSGTRKDGTPFHTSAVVFPLKESEGIQYACIQRDVSEERKLYEHLLRAQKLEAMGTLAGGIAHDFNNILAAILGFADLIGTVSREPETVVEYSRTIYNAAQQGAELSRKLLASTRKEKTRVQRVDLNGVVRESLSFLARSIPKNIEVVDRLAEGLPLVEGDPSQLQQVIVNLAVNARDAMPEGGRLAISTERGGGGELGAGGIAANRRGWVRLTVSDSGIGMDEGTREKVFDPFFTTKETGKGTGLGLFIVHSIVAAHGGAINLYSEPGRGTRFSIYLPAAEAGEEGGAGDGAGADGEDEDSLRGSGMVLVIDDEPNVLDMCSAVLASLGYTVLSAGGGPEGLALFRARRGEVRAVVLDLIMPRMGGEEVYREIRRMDPSVKVLLCSGYNPDGYEGIEALLGQGVEDFVPKPFSRRSLGRALRKALRS